MTDKSLKLQGGTGKAGLSSTVGAGESLGKLTVRDPQQLPVKALVCTQVSCVVPGRAVGACSREQKTATSLKRWESSTHEALGAVSSIA